jgi:hypothetical protein
LCRPNSFSFRVKTGNEPELNPTASRVNLLRDEGKSHLSFGGKFELVIPPQGTEGIMIPISQFFDMKEPGHYEITVAPPDHSQGLTIDPPIAVVTVDVKDHFHHRGQR